LKTKHIIFEFLKKNIEYKMMPTIIQIPKNEYYFDVSH